MKRSVITSICMASVMMAAGRSALAAYVATDLGLLPTGTFIDYSAGGGNYVNNSGQVTGQADTNNPGFQVHPFIYSGSLTDILPAGATNGSGSGINNAGQVYGTFKGPSTGNNLHMFLYDPSAGTPFQDILPLAGDTVGGFPAASHQVMNASGQVIGFSRVGSGTQHGFVYTSGAGGVAQAIPLIAGGVNSVPNGISDNGIVVGTAFTSGFRQAFWYDATGNTMHQLPTLGVGGNSGIAQVITPSATTSSGLIGGTLDDGGAGHITHLAVYDLANPGAGWQNRGTLVSPNGAINSPTNMTINGINSSGKLFGTGQNASSQNDGFIYDPSTASLFDINNIFGSTISHADYMNASGEVAGVFVLGGINHAFLYNAGTATDLGTIGNGAISLAGLDDAGMLFGTYHIGSASAAFLSSGNSLIDLTTLVTLPADATLSPSLKGGNDSYLIGTGYASPADVTAGNSHEFLISVVPEPASLSLLALGSMTLLTRRRKA